ncbi:flagellar basal body rod protein FlgB [Planctomicrobium sp. SH661]|uniref:flagellar basal body rod protein FlgB n=1 Tax=Planctomicrobium sp. SH661 TaxID=3448124 RepID=UPI003F5C18B2
MFPLPPQIDHLSQLMGAAQLRHGVISQNLANVNTPGYHRLDVQFEDLLAAHLKGGDKGATDVPRPVVVQEKGLNERSDGNNVDIDREIGQLNRNAMLFQTYSQIMSSQFDLMRRATS